MSFFGGRRQQEGPERTAPAKPTVPPPAPRQPVGFQTVLGNSTILEGRLHGQGNVRLDGIFEGILEIDGNILVGETAQITADINARNISIAGAVKGNVNGNKVQILRTGRVWGDINAAAITTEEGAFIDGKITMLSHDAALHKLEPPVPPQPVVSAEPDFLAELDAEQEVGAPEEVVEDHAPAVEAELVSDAELVEDDLQYTDLEEDAETLIEFEDEDDRDLPVDEDGAVG